MELFELGVLNLIVLGLLVVFVALLITLAAVCCSKPSSTSDSSQLGQLRASSQQFIVPYSELTFGKLLGKGSQGEVYLAQWRGSTVAVKRIDTRKVDPAAVEEFCQEANIMRQLRHPSLTLFLGICIEEPDMCIITEYVDRGSLFDIIHDDHSPFTWQRGMRILTDVARGLTYLHSHKPPILHRDLKSLNILVDENWRGKVADFGMTRFQEDGATMTQCGSPLWMAPEMIRNLAYDEKSDVYSFGICLWEIYTRKIPYRNLGLSPSNLVIKVVKDHLRPEAPSTIPKPYFKLMERCWHPSPEKRPSFKQILRVLESFVEDPVLLGHVPFSNKQSAQMSDTGNLSQLRKDKKKKKPEVPQLQGGWRVDNAADVDVDSMGCNDREAFVTRMEGLAINRDSDAFTPHHFIGVAQTDSAECNALIVKTQVSASNDGGDVDTLINTGAVRDHRHVPTHPPDLSFARFRGKNVTVRKLFLTALSGDAEETKSDLLPAYMTKHYNNNAVYRKSRKVSMDKATNAKVQSLMHDLGDLRHPNLVLFMGAFIATDHVGIVLEHMEQGSLAGILQRQELTLEWDVMLSLLLDVAQALKSLSSAKTPLTVVNFTPDAILVDNFWRCKLYNDVFRSLDHLVYGTSPAPNPAPSAYTAPECIDNIARLSVESNVYSFGIIANEVFSRAKPYGGSFDTRTMVQVLKKGLRPAISGSMPQMLAELVTRCWSANPSERPSLDMVLSCLEAQKAQGPPRLDLVLGSNAHKYHKSTTIHAYQTADPVTVLKDWGRNYGKGGSFVVCSKDDDVYVVDQDIFHRTYVPVNAARKHEYRKVGSVIAREMEEPFAVKVKANTIEHGGRGDFLIQNEVGEQWVVEGHIFNELYEMSMDSAPKTASENKRNLYDAQLGTPASSRGGVRGNLRSPPAGPVPRASVLTIMNAPVAAKVPSSPSHSASTASFRRGSVPVMGGVFSSSSHEHSTSERRTASAGLNSIRGVSGVEMQGITLQGSSFNRRQG